MRQTKVKRAADRFYKSAAKETAARKKKSRLHSAWSLLSMNLFEELEKLRRAATKKRF
jgi:hypothetical protein